MASPIGSRGTFEITRDTNGSSLAIHISEQAGVKADNLSLSTWGASFVLANLLHKIHKPLVDFPCGGTDGSYSKRPSVLELGAGTGLVGLSAAALWGYDVILTDVEMILPGLVANIALNKGVLKSTSVSCGALDWNDPESLRIFSKRGQSLSPRDLKADIILAADTIYSEEHPELLRKTILTWLAKGPQARVIMCYPLRMAYIDHVRDFWDLMEASGLECVDEGREESDESWNEIANTPYEWCVWAWKSAHVAT